MSVKSPDRLAHRGGLLVLDSGARPLRGYRRAGRRAQLGLRRLVRGGTRVEYLRAFAGGYQALRDQGIEALVLESLVHYRIPARFDDELVVHCRCVGFRGARFRYEYAITRGEEIVADGHTEHACVDAQTFRPTRVPAWLAEAISAAEATRAS
jgi:acyl-CoA thioester hydrolase